LRPVLRGCRHMPPAGRVHQPAPAGDDAAGDPCHAPDGTSGRDGLPPSRLAMAAPCQGTQPRAPRRRLVVWAAARARTGGLAVSAVAADAAVGGFVPLSSHVAADVVKTTGGDYLLAWRLGGLPFVGREEWDLEHRHATFNRMLQTLRAPDFANVAFWTHDIRRRKRIDGGGCFAGMFNQALSDAYFASLSEKESLQNDLYLTMLYRPVVAGRRLVERSAVPRRLAAAEQQAGDRVHKRAGSVEAVLKDYSPERLCIYDGDNGVAFSRLLELYAYVLNRVSEPVPVLSAPIADYLPVSRVTFSARTGDFVVATPSGKHHYGAILNIKEYTDATWPGILNGLKYLGFEYVLTQSFSPMGRQDALRILDRTKGMMVSSGDRAVSQIVELDQAMD